MSRSSKTLGTLKPIGGGDPVPLQRESMIIGRRASADICLDFENVSGKHCELKFFHGIWHIRDLGSRNGTTVNGLKIAIEQTVLPDAEIGIASHFYTIDYEPAGPASAVAGTDIMDEDMVETRQRKSLMELAGFETDKPRKSYRPARPPEEIERIPAAHGSFDDPVPASAPVPKSAKARSMVEATDDDFFNLIADDLVPKKKP